MESRPVAADHRDLKIYEVTESTLIFDQKLSAPFEFVSQDMMCSNQSISCEKDSEIGHIETLEGRSPESNFFHCKASEHLKELKFAEDKAELRAEMDQLRITLFSALGREADLKQSLKICCEVIFFASFGIFCT
jgi:hypothetical protein